MMLIYAAMEGDMMPLSITDHLKIISECPHIPPEVRTLLKALNVTDKHNVTGEAKNTALSQNSDPSVQQYPLENSID